MGLTSTLLGEFVACSARKVPDGPGVPVGAPGELADADTAVEHYGVGVGGKSRSSYSPAKSSRANCGVTLNSLPDFAYRFEARLSGC